MSAISGALMWVVKRDSDINMNELSENELKIYKKEVHKTIGIIANIRQRFLDGYYSRVDKNYSDAIYYRNGTHESEKVWQIVGISLWDGSVILQDEWALRNKENFEKHYNGVRGKIHLILETPDALISIDVSTISEISSYFWPKEIDLGEIPQDPVLIEKINEEYRGVLARAMDKEWREIV